MKILSLIYALLPFIIFSMLGLIFDITLFEVLLLVIISEAIIGFFTLLTKVIKIKFKYLRKGIHISGIILILLSLYFNVERILLFTFLLILFFLSLPLNFFPRKFKFLFEDVVEEAKDVYDTDSLTSVIHFLGAMMVLSSFTPYNILILTLLITLVGDPSSYFIGKKFGKRKIIREKTLKGTFAFLVSSFLILYFYSKNPILSFVLSLTGALTELFTGKWIDDNASVLLIVSFVAYLFLIL